MKVRPAIVTDAAEIARIYSAGIEERVATFETRPRSAADVERWFDGVHPVVVVEDEDGVFAFASTSQYRSRECYAGIAEFSVYVAREARGRGAGRVAMNALIDAARAAGFSCRASSWRTKPAARSCARWDFVRSASTSAMPSSMACGGTW